MSKKIFVMGSSNVDFVLKIPRFHRAGETILAENRVTVFGGKGANQALSAKRLGGEGWPEGTLVVAEEQTAGRGRLGRQWSSLPGGLWFSLIVKPGLALTDLGPLTVAAAVALAKAVRLQTEIKPSIKWPNDLVYNGRKLAGILAEASGELGRVDLVVLGIGLNINQNLEDFPATTRARATTLRELTGREVPRLPILREFLTVFEEMYRTDAKEAFRGAVAEASAFSATIGQKVRLARGGTVIEGQALRLDPDGALVVQASRGLVRVLAGELVET